MDLKEFVRETLVQIAQGVADAATPVSELGGAVSPTYSSNKESSGSRIGSMQRDGVQIPVFAVSFDVAVVVGSSLGAGGGGKIQVAGLFSAGGKGGASQKEETTSRIQFVVPLTMPVDAKAMADSKARAGAEQAAVDRFHASR